MMRFLGKRVRMTVLACSVLFISEFAGAEMARYEIDPEHTTIGFGAGHIRRAMLVPALLQKERSIVGITTSILTASGITAA